MNWPYLHLLINHFPVVLTAIGAAAVVLSLFVRRRPVWLYAVASITLAGLTAYPTFATGDESMDLIRETPALRSVVSMQAIERHDDSAGITLWILLISGALAAYAWWRTVKRAEETPPTWLRAVVTVLALVALGSVTWAAELGGRVAHGLNTVTSSPSLLPSPPTAADSAEAQRGGERGP